MTNPATYSNIHREVKSIYFLLKIPFPRPYPLHSVYLHIYPPQSAKATASAKTPAKVTTLEPLTTTPLEGTKV